MKASKKAAQGKVGPQRVRQSSEHLTNNEIARLRPATEVLPGIAAAYKKGVRGPQIAPKKVPVSIRLSPDVLAYFKAKGTGWQTKVDDTLRQAIEKKRA